MHHRPAARPLCPPQYRAAAMCLCGAKLVRRQCLCACHQLLPRLSPPFLKNLFIWKIRSYLCTCQKVDGLVLFLHCVANCSIVFIRIRSANIYQTPTPCPVSAQSWGHSPRRQGQSGNDLQTKMYGRTHNAQRCLLTWSPAPNARLSGDSACFREGRSQAHFTRKLAFGWIGRTRKSIRGPWDRGRKACPVRGNGEFSARGQSMGRDEMQTAGRDQIVKRFDVIMKDVDLVL